MTKIETKPQPFLIYISCYLENNIARSFYVSKYGTIREHTTFFNSNFIMLTDVHINENVHYPLYHHFFEALNAMRDLLEKICSFIIKTLL